MGTNTIDNVEETKQLRDLIDTASICVLTTDTDGIVTSINRAGEKLYGYRSDEIVGKNVNILFSDRNSRVLIEEIDEKRLKGERWEAEVWRTRKDGSEIVTWLSTSYLFDEKGHNKGTLGISRDVTRDRKDAERLRILKELINTASICMMTTDKKGTVTSINRAGERLYGYRVDEIRGENVNILFSDRNPKTLIAKMDEKRLKGEDWEAEVWRKRKDGSQILTWLSTSYLFDGEGNCRGTLGISRDITQERDVQNKYKLLWDLVNNAMISIIQIDREGNIISINKTGEYMFGYRADEIEGKNVNILFSDRNPPELLSEIEKKRLNGEDWEAELWRKRKDGRELLCWISTSYLIDSEGKLQGALGLTRDITKEKKSRAKLKFMVSLVENCSICVFTTDKEGIIRSMNKASQEVFGYSEEEIIGKHLNVLHSPSVSEDVINELYETIGQGKAWEGEMLGQKKGGILRWGWLSISGSFDENRNIMGMVGMVREITEEREARKKLELLVQLVENSAHCIVSTDESGRIISINKAAEDMYGYREEELLGKDISIIYSDKNPPSLNDELIEKSRKGESWECELWRKKKSGEEFPTWVSTSYIFDEIGKIKGAIGIGRDITDKKVIEEKLLQSTRLSTMGEIAVGIAHEVRNPLTSIKLGLNSLSESVTDKPAAVEIIDDLFGEMERLERVVAQLLDFAKMKEPYREKRDINEILDRTLFYIRKTVEKQKIDIIKIYDEKLPFVEVDGDQILQVFLNLVLNAVQAMEENGCLKIKTNLYAFRDSNRQVTKEIMVEIKDSGSGIPAEEISKVFSPFFTTREQGTGLGLAMSKRIIEAHAGTIEITSREGEGTTVKILLPCE